jgi:hypothetical protein
MECSKIIELFYVLRGFVVNYLQRRRQKNHK